MKWPAAVSDMEHTLRLQQLLYEMEDTGCVTNYINGKYRPFYALSIERGYQLVSPPGNENRAVYNAYVNLRYHATHPGALFRNDESTRAGVEMAIQALKKKAGAGR